MKALQTKGESTGVKKNASSTIEYQFGIAVAQGAMFVGALRTLGKPAGGYWIGSTRIGEGVAQGHGAEVATTFCKRSLSGCLFCLQPVHQVSAVCS